MSLNLPSRRLVKSALTSSSNLLPSLGPCIQRRNGWFQSLVSKGKGRKELPPRVLGDNLNEEYLRKKPKQAMPTMGGLAESSIFEDEEIAGPKPERTARKLGDVERQPPPPRSKHSMAAALDPDPKNRMRWERKMVIKDIHKRGRLSKVQVLKRTERVSVSKSHDFKTSVKKLMPLARQIAGKTVEDAIIQMRFSKKQVAKDVREHLEHARNEAILKRGMGLGLKGENFTPRQIQTKDKKRVKVTDPTTMYVDQAWVGKGLFGVSPDYRARGQVYLMKNPSTSLSVILKEEKTRLRLHEERERREKNRKVWVQLPNRPITAQRQFYSW